MIFHSKAPQRRLSLIYRKSCKSTLEAFGCYHLDRRIGCLYCYFYSVKERLSVISKKAIAMQYTLPCATCSLHKLSFGDVGAVVDPMAWLRAFEANITRRWLLRFGRDVGCIAIAISGSSHGSSRAHVSLCLLSLELLHHHHLLEALLILHWIHHAHFHDRRVKCHIVHHILSSTKRRFSININSLLTLFTYMLKVHTVVGHCIAQSSVAAIAYRRL